MHHKVNFSTDEVFESQWLFSSSQGQFDKQYANNSDEQGGSVPFKKQIRKHLKRQEKNVTRLKYYSIRRPRAPHNTTQYILKMSEGLESKESIPLITFNSMIGKIKFSNPFRFGIDRRNREARIDCAGKRAVRMLPFNRQSIIIQDNEEQQPKLDTQRFPDKNMKNPLTSITHAVNIIFHLSLGVEKRVKA